MRKITFPIGGMALAALFSTGQPANAQESNGSQQIDECRSIKDRDARLACYDALPVTAASPGTATRRRDMPKDDFGLSERRMRSERATAQSVDSTIEALRISDGGERELTLANGQVWTVTSDGRLGKWLEPGQTAHISSGFMSGYRLRIDGVKGIAVVHRVR